MCSTATWRTATISMFKISIGTHLGRTTVAVMRTNINTMYTSFTSPAPTRATPMRRDSAWNRTCVFVLSRFRPISTNPVGAAISRVCTCLTTRANWTHFTPASSRCRCAATTGCGTPPATVREPACRRSRSTIRRSRTSLELPPLSTASAA